MVLTFSVKTNYKGKGGQLCKHQKQRADSFLFVCCFFTSEHPLDAVKKQKQKHDGNQNWIQMDPQKNFPKQGGFSIQNARAKWGNIVLSSGITSWQRSSQWRHGQVMPLSHKCRHKLHCHGGVSRWVSVSELPHKRWLEGQVIFREDILVANKAKGLVKAQVINTNTSQN